MENKLSIWYNIEKSDDVKGEIEKALQHNYGFSDSEFEPIENGFKFLLDDETNGHIEITYADVPDALNVTIAGTWAWEVVEVFRQIMPDYVQESA